MTTTMSMRKVGSCMDNDNDNDNDNEKSRSMPSESGHVLLSSPNPTRPTSPRDRPSAWRSRGTVGREVETDSTRFEAYAYMHDTRLPLLPESTATAADRLRERQWKVGALISYPTSTGSRHSPFRLVLGGLC